MRWAVVLLGATALLSAVFGALTMAVAPAVFGRS
jgi:hypothetical protein